MRYKMKVTARSGLNIRTGAGINFSKTGSAMALGTEVIATQTKSGWYLHDRGGWSSGEYLQKIADLEPVSNPAMVTPGLAVPPPITLPGPTANESELIRSIITDLNYSTTSIDTMNFIYGMPPQFTAESDPRPAGSEYGRYYLQTIVEDIPLLVMTPGKASFLQGLGQAARNGIKDSLAKLTRGDESADGGLDAILEGKEYGRYYTFESDYTEYIKYVNNMCRLTALYLGISDKTPYGYNTTYKNFDWHAYNGSMQAGKNGLFSFLAESPSLAFFIDAKQSSFGESSSNSTEQSMLEGVVGKGGDTIKEFRFLMNSAIDDSGIIESSKTNYESAVKKILDSVKLSKLPIANQFTDYGTTIVAGGNIAFPEVWKDSNYGRSYSIEIKLVSPYGDKESIYWYIMVPLFHLVALAFPRQLGRSGYMHPFLLRAFCKGWFNCNLGIVDSINIKKAAQDGWSKDGLPTEIDVSISIKDLYENLSLARTPDLSTFSNTEYLDFLATMSGININKPDIARKITMYKMWLANKITDLPGDWLSGTMEGISDILRKYTS